MTNFKRIYQSLDNYDEFVKTYRLSKEENFNENLIFKKIEDSGMSHIEATHLQNHVKFLLSKKPSAQLTAMLIAQGVEVDICPVQDEGSIYLKAAMDGKNSYVIYQLLKYIDMDIIVDTLIKADKKEMLKDFPVNENFYISVLANILKKYSQTIKNSQETHQDIDFYKSLMKKDFSMEILDTYLEKYLENIKSSMNQHITHKLSNKLSTHSIMAYLNQSLSGPLKIITFEAPVEYIYDKIASSANKVIYTPYIFIKDYAYQKEAQLLYLSMSLEKDLQTKIKIKSLKI